MLHYATDYSPLIAAFQTFVSRDISFIYISTESIIRAYYELFISMEPDIVL